ncbi:Uma2 family endonuclease [Argonema antarcticum]|uniref:Uma2 family endonuclease n=1 Tax=Argonema antarcticum TaxID=2942763 RepID=UPI00201101AD|nr:Uma2 family endonuclease [Argonema antarcticum]MCL1472149.1 Uma2 family endonuclease [Argonema antarcticum A004/B2]
MFNYDPKLRWPSAEDLPDSDDTPVDNELQDLIPSLLKAILALLWANRMDWFFGVDMGIYYNSQSPPIVPDGFLSLGVERFVDEEELRASYAIWEEKKTPIFALEVISGTYRGEFTTKKAKYAELGVLYYAVYNPRRRRKPPLEVYRLVDGSYEYLPENPVWMPEIGLGIGREEGTYQGIRRDWLYWYDEQGQRLLTPEELVWKEREGRLQAERRAQMLAERLRSLGLDPDSLI